MSKYDEDLKGFEVVDAPSDLSPWRKDERSKERQCWWRGCITKLHIYKPDITNTIVAGKVEKVFGRSVALCYLHEKRIEDELREILLSYCHPDMIERPRLFDHFADPTEENLSSTEHKTKKPVA